MIDQTRVPETMGGSQAFAMVIVTEGAALLKIIPANPSAAPAKATPKPATATTDQASAPGHLPSNAASNLT